MLSGRKQWPSKRKMYAFVQLVVINAHISPDLPGADQISRC